MPQSKNKWIMLAYNEGILQLHTRFNSPMIALNIIQLIIVINTVFTPPHIISYVKHACQSGILFAHTSSPVLKSASNIMPVCY